MLGESQEFGRIAIQPDTEGAGQIDIYDAVLDLIFGRNARPDREAKRK